MSHLPLLYSTRNNPISAVIRGVTWSRWSHVGVIDYKAGEVIESVMVHGVRAVSLSDAMDTADKYLIASIRCQDPELALACIRSQVGKRYDYSALLGILIHRDWQNMDKQFCAELIAWGIEMSGTQLFRTESMHRITQQDLFAQSFVRHPEDIWRVPPRNKF